MSRDVGERRKEDGQLGHAGGAQLGGEQVGDLREALIMGQDAFVSRQIDGLLGLNFLRPLNYEIRSKEGRIIAELA